VPASADGVGRAAREHSGLARGVESSLLQPSRASLETSRFGVTRARVHVVDSEAGVLDVMDAILGDTARESASGSTGYEDLTPLGIDVEWEPYGRSQPATPVATLQLATRRGAWVLDMQRLCRSVRVNKSERRTAEAGA
jgi:hypothetical protein